MYKGCRNGLVVTLELDRNDPNTLERSNVDVPNYAMYRCRRAKVVKIENVLTGETAEMAISGYDEQFCYKVGEVVEVPEYSAEIEKVCGNGIHFYLTKEAAKFHALGLMNFEGYTGEFKSWHDNGQCWKHGVFKDGKPDGEWEWWHPNGQREVHGWFKDGEKDGEWEWWHENGQRRAHGEHKDGKKDGEWEEWYKNGGRLEHGWYKDGKEDGEFEWWYGNGQRSDHGWYKDGEKVGEWEWRDVDGQCHNCEWKNGKRCQALGLFGVL